MTTQPTATGHTVTVYLTIRDAARAIDFYKNVFGAVETMRLAEPGGRIGHAEIRIGDTAIMLSDEHPDMGILGPQSRGGSTAALHIKVADADAIFAKAVAAGAQSIRPVADQFYGERSGQVADPFGHVWFIATQKENLSAEEMKDRFAKIINRS